MTQPEEFESALDALPIRQFGRTPNGWAELMVGVGQDGQLAFGLRPADRGFDELWEGKATTGIIGKPGEDGDRHAHERRTVDQEEAVIEVSPARAGAMAALAERICRDGLERYAGKLGVEEFSRLLAVLSPPPERIGHLTRALVFRPHYPWAMLQRSAATRFCWPRRHPMTSSTLQ